MMSTEHDEMTITEIVGEHIIPCDFSESASCPKEGAQWVLHCIPCACGQGGFRLCCTSCKDLRLLSEGGVRCAGCDAVTIPARLAYSSCEPLDHKP
jgi:hypothetical protein